MLFPSLRRRLPRRSATRPSARGARTATRPTARLAAVAAGIAGIAVLGLLTPAPALAAPTGHVDSRVVGPVKSVVAGGMATVIRTFPASTAGFDSYEATTTITREPGSDGKTFWSNQWGFARSSSGAYIGLQQRSGTQKYINFSIWDASAYRDVAPGTSCGPFGGEGIGIKCELPFDWKEGVTYRFTIARSGANGWGASITDVAKGATTRVATIATPTDRGGLRSLMQWVEHFAQGSDQPATCAGVPASTVVYGQPTANGGTVRPTSSTSYTYGNCAAIARTQCGTDQSCTIAANPASVAPSSAAVALKNGGQGYCIDLLSGGTAAGLWSCLGNANQAIVRDGSGRLVFSQRGGLCLTPDKATRRVNASACVAGDSAQQWEFVQSTSSYFNVGTGLCLDALGNGVSGAAVQVTTCYGNQFQKWTAHS